MEKLAELDRELFLYLNNLGTENWDWLWAAISNKWTAIPLYAFLLFLLFKKFGWKSTLVTIVVVVLLITATDQLANLFKHGFERSRPCGEPGVMEYARMVVGRCGRFGYFSAHAANSTGVAVFLSLIFRRVYSRLVYFLVFWALIVSYSRIYLGVHYPGDVITGWFFGALLGYFFYKLREYVIARLIKNSGQV